MKEYIHKSIMFYISAYLKKKCALSKVFSIMFYALAKIKGSQVWIESMPLIGFG